MKVAKFGGSSLCNATQLTKVANIIKEDEAIRFVVVSAPGKRDETDIKVTDLLIALHEQVVTQQDYSESFNTILARFANMVEALKLSSTIIQHFEKVLRQYIQTIHDSERLLDALKACGEDFNAQLFSQYLLSLGVNAQYISPKDFGFVVTDEPGNAQLLPESYEKMAQFRDSDAILIIPGFFGYSKEGNIVTFPRGGSDISGAIVARGVRADIYENFTDQSYIYAAHPGIIDNPYAIKEITYREMRELSYSGFGIFHDEALEPLFQVNIPVMVRNTNQPEIKGTKIVAQRQYQEELPVVGISCDEGFTAISIRKYLLNRQLGFTRRLLQIFEDHNVSIEHIPTGIDNISVVVRSHYLEGVLDSILQEIQDKLRPDNLMVEDDLAIMVVVGEGMVAAHGMANKTTEALAQEKISIRMINQGASEISMFFTIRMKDKLNALQAMYRSYFE
ncbi:aspartate kinase [Tuanshanicoccus lijuaniae]|uniref:aspartate kinase n=1 Tax=Aerococcaceae bacterium zg-1292 TaxID=2774330 RepID=UPI001936222F|nr:aspartate kinase [Aerococcaceae bacterium zg-1292]MBS4456096.1 aspartate kinase [Aerococcaceae bacterium zg-A91]MBS4457848.1 aspartate kinase [Aerococcaceae bacterium zg-BR33]QQA37635.1 aspartate kinase [Aerococcaceae bacterium zg-1292]